jgi:hypothetical protein
MRKFFSVKKNCYHKQKMLLLRDFFMFDGKIAALCVFVFVFVSVCVFVFWFVFHTLEDVPIGADGCRQGARE